MSEATAAVDLNGGRSAVLMLPAVFALVFGALALLAAGFQLALALGMPWGTLTWGGRFPGRLPGYMRGVAVISAALLATFALVVAVRAGLLLPEWRPLSRSVIWVVVGYSALGVVAHAVTPSPKERRLWLPIVLMMLACSVAVAAG
jgi:hypothetical protein